MKVLGKTKVSLFELLYFLCMLLYAGYASTFARELGFLGKPGNSFALIITAIFVIFKRIKFNNRYLIIIAIFLVYTLINFLANSYTSFGFIAQWLILFTIAFVLCEGFKGRFLYIYETCLLILCIIGLAFWVVFLIMPETLVSFMYQNQFSTVFNDARPTVNMLVYTVNTRLDYEGLSEFTLFRRNAGFAWEPGAFACFICFAIFCNILRKGIQFKKNLPLLIYFAALLSTESTTGFFITAIMFVVAILITNQGRKYAFLVIPIAALVVFGLPFVSAKFLREASLVNQINLADIDEGGYGRLFSLKLSLMEFLHNPIFGSGASGNTLLHEMGYDISIFSGIGNLLSNFGLFMTVGFFYLVVCSVHQINNVVQSRLGYLLWIPLMGLMISYNIWNTPIIMFFWLFGFYCTPTLSKNDRS